MARSEAEAAEQIEGPAPVARRRLSEEEAAQKKYEEEMTRQYEQKVENPEDVEECLWNNFGPSPINIFRGCVMVIERVYDTKYINDQGFRSEDLHFSDFVDPDTEEMLFEAGEDKTVKYKDEMLTIMRDCMIRLEAEEDVNEAVESYEK